MFEKIKNSGKLPLIIGITVAAIIIVIVAVIIGININKSSKTNSDANVNDENREVSQEEDLTVTVPEDEELIVTIPEDEEVENEETSEETETNQNTDIKYFIRVNYGQNVVNIYTKDANGEYTVPYKAMLCSTGKATPRSGTYTMPSSGSKLPRGTWGLMFGNVWAQYFTRITGSILFHSVPYTERNKWSLEYWEYDKLGTAASLGCVRLTVENAKWIYDNCPAGTKVEFYTDSNPGPFGKPTEQKISEHEEVRGWDPTDPAANNPWKTYTPKQEEPEQSDTTTIPPTDTTTTPPTTPPTPTEPDNSTGNETQNPSEDENLDSGTETPGNSGETDEGTEIPDESEESVTPSNPTNPDESPNEDNEGEKEGETTPSTPPLEGTTSQEQTEEI